MTAKRLLTTALLALLTLTIAVPAQCPVTTDDGFNPGCGTPVTAPVVPSFPALWTSGSYGCLNDCSVEATFQNRVRLTYFPALCDIAQIQIDVVPGTPGAPAFSGFLLAKYSRTFIQTDPSGVTRQVWRFLVNGDLTFDPTASGPAPCPLPTSSTFGLPVHFFGSIDYFCDFNSPAGFRVRYDLSHLPKCYSHAPWSQRPLPAASIPGSRSYHLVGPAPFNFAGGGAPQGSFIGEATRASEVIWSPFSYICLSETPTVQGQITTLGASCPCPTTSTAPSRYREQAFFGTNACGSSVASYASIPVPGISGAGGMMALGLGNYANGDRLTVYWGLMQHTDPLTLDGPVHVVHGSGVGYAGFFNSFHGPSTTPQPRVAIDLANAKPLTTGFPPTLGWGSLHVSTLVFQINL